ncbi:MAG: CHASE domain-containing protein [Pseudomonadota bacterium]
MGALCAALVATFASWELASGQLDARRQAEFDVQVRQTIRLIEQRMATYQQVQRGVQAFLLGSTEVPADDFKSYVQTLRLNEKFPGIQGIALVRLVPLSELRSHTAARQQRFPAYAIRPAGERSTYSSIIQIEPYAGSNLRAIGYDMLTDPVRRLAMERARDSGEPAASGKVRLIQESGVNEQAGMVVYLPVYRRGFASATQAERRRNIVGWVGAPFRIDDLMTGLFGERVPDISLTIYDGAPASDSARMYTSDHAVPDTAGAPVLRAVRGLTVAGREWTLEMASTPAFAARLDSYRPLSIALVGALASLLLAWVVWLLAASRQHAVLHAHDATEKLSESEFRWKYALEGAGDGVWDWDRSTGVSSYSKRWKEMLGYAEWELSDTAAEWERLIHPDDVARVSATLKRYAESTHQTYEAQYRMRCKDGSWRWILARGMAVTRDVLGLPARTIGTHTDITRSKQDEHTLREAYATLASEQKRIQVILQHSHDAFIAVGPDGRITDWNAKAEEMLGYAAAEAIGQTVAELIVPEEYRTAHNRGFAHFVASGKRTFTQQVVEVTALHRSGRLVPVELAIAGFPTPAGHAASAFMRDISERKQAQQLEAERSVALEEARTALQHAQKLEAVGKLTGGIAHDFNNVLHVISGNVQLLQVMRPADERLQARLKHMQSAVDRGAKLSTQLLAFARRQPLEPVVINLLALVRNMDDLLSRALGQAVRVAIHADPDLWNISADAGQLENVILNLALNARDAMPDGGVLTVELRNQGAGPAIGDLPPGDYVRMSLADTGKGMSDEVRAAAFEPFFTTKGVGQGTGLGLSMAYGFIKQSGGHIIIESAPDAGTTVLVYLPRSLDVLPGVEIRPLESSVGGNETILVVEDDHDVRATVLVTLQELGYVVIEAEDGEAALRILENGRIVDLLFTDVVMPGPVSSVELATRAAEILPTIAVLFTSGYTRDALVTKGRLNEGVQLLGKPYKRSDLSKKVREALTRGRGRRALRAEPADN